MSVKCGALSSLKRKNANKQGFYGVSPENRHGANAGYHYAKVIQFCREKKHVIGDFRWRNLMLNNVKIEAWRVGTQVLVSLTSSDPKCELGLLSANINDSKNIQTKRILYDGAKDRCKAALWLDLPEPLVPLRPRPPLPVLNVKVFSDGEKPELLWSDHEVHVSGKIPIKVLKSLGLG